MKISIIACVGKRLELGRDNDLVFHIKEDLKYFKKVTDNHIVVMGKKTFESLPGVLKNRTNVVLTRSLDKISEDVLVFNSIEKFLEEYKDCQDEIFIIGGASIYKQFLPIASTLYLTEVDKEVEADVYFPEFDKTLYEKEIIEEKIENDINYKFVIYRRK